MAKIRKHITKKTIATLRAQMDRIEDELLGMKYDKELMEIDLKRGLKIKYLRAIAVTKKNLDGVNADIEVAEEDTKMLEKAITG